ncbi:MAG: hypothetical protein JW795_02805, partial [Chitinivibrionales bacterium]|nr:hypothetical protein [Chitinivibrionales bacterium]
DGDGSNELLVLWKNTQNGKYISVYSYLKKTYLLLVAGAGEYPSWHYGDLDKDGCVEVMVDNRVYSKSDSGIKKNSF